VLPKADEVILPSPAKVTGQLVHTTILPRLARSCNFASAWHLYLHELSPLKTLLPIWRKAGAGVTSDCSADPDLWGKVPQLRTIPVGESVGLQTEVMPYEGAEALVRAQKTFAVANCICRQELRILGEGCDKPLESCLAFGMAAEHSVRTGRGRAIGQEEALTILHRAEEAALVLQPHELWPSGLTIWSEYGIIPIGFVDLFSWWSDSETLKKR
jgi:hypothetical protein